MSYSPTSEFDALTNLTIPATITHNGNTYTVSEIESDFLKNMFLSNLKSFGFEEGIKKIGTINPNAGSKLSTWDNYLDGIASTEIPASVEEVSVGAFNNFERIINSSNVDVSNCGAPYVIDSNTNYNFNTDAKGNRFFYNTSVVNTIVGVQIKDSSEITIPVGFDNIDSLNDPTYKNMSLNSTDVLDLGNNITYINETVSVMSYSGTPAIIYKGTTYDDAADAATLNALLVSDNITTNNAFWDYQITT